ncbi:SRPBCC family protein [Bradyrhizobium australiense]|uniref:ATPase n=1 Tax=Bradyrhizobium australiense TaxID=2721161 RepID=A0A7Y4GN78_9BRAD|nr:SRPBCC family protein [Bradyrhizobium australiense]NOJ38874.1 ATPase [Bradyrhizobium australiense]
MLKIKPAPICRSVTVTVPPQQAFKVFTSDIGLWWPASHKIGKAPFKSAVIEPRTGGRWYEVGDDGSECSWGDVLAWEPPSRLVLAWRIGADWQFDSSLLTEVEVKFVPTESGGTRIELEHRLLENMGEGAEGVRDQFESEHGWAGVLNRYAAATKSDH